MTSRSGKALSLARNASALREGQLGRSLSLPKATEPPGLRENNLVQLSFFGLVIVALHGSLGAGFIPASAANIRMENYENPINPSTLIRTVRACRFLGM